jgi:ketosteroid isomerase-like protein
MLKVVAKITCLLLIFSFFTSCGDVGGITPPQPQELVSINQVLKNWRDGYQNEDLDTYMSVFWEDGFLYTSDMGTKNDKTDDVVFDDIRDERDSAQRVFARFQDIEIELSEPPDMQLNTDRTRAEVRNHYRIQGFVADGDSLEGGFTGWFAEGDNVFTFELRADKDSGKQQWRITEWSDEAFSEEQIRAANNIP